MKEHYEAVLKDMEDQEKRLEAQLTKIRAARPAILALMEDAAPKPIQSPPLFVPLKYASMGTKEAVLDVLAHARNPMSSQEIASKLREGGIRTQSNDFGSVINSTLANLKKAEVAERKEDGWILPPANRPVSSPAPWSPIASPPPLPQ